MVNQALLLGDAINHAYQAGGDEQTLRNVALAQRDALPENERAAFTDAIEMCGLVIDA